MSVIKTLKERIALYEEQSDYRFFPRLPIIITINGRSFRKSTSLLPKPFSAALLELISATTVKLMHEIDGAIAAYSFNDQIVIAILNDKEDTWYDGKIQQIVSVCSSIATLEFNKIAKENNIPLFNDAIFFANGFSVPTITEAINTLISKQQQAFHIAVYNAAFYELLKLYNIEVVKETLYGKTAEEKIEILREQCKIDFDSYPTQFRRGVLCYRVRQNILSSGGEVVKNKLLMNMDLPVFAKTPEFLSEIFKK